MSNRSYRLGRLALAAVLSVLLVGTAAAQRRVLYQPPSSDDKAPPPDAPPPPPDLASAGKTGPYAGPSPYMTTVAHAVGPAVSATPFAPPTSMTAAPYVLNTAPRQSIPYGTPGAPFAMPFPYGGWGMGWGAGSRGAGYGMALQGVASVTAATGQYWQDIEQARITREQSRQASLDTRKKTIEAELWYESIKPKTADLLETRRQNDLNIARGEAPRTEVWSGRTLNVLMQSILRSPTPLYGPNVPLEPNTIRALNLTDRATRGNLAMAKDDGKVVWTEALLDPAFDDVRTGFEKHFAAGIRSVNDGRSPERSTISDLRNDLQQMTDKLNDMVSTIAPGRFTESSRLLRQLRDNVDGLANPRLLRTAGGGWRKEVQTVRDLVAHLQKNGLEFGPALEGEESSYTAAYFALRTYERGVTQLASK